MRVKTISFSWREIIFRRFYCDSSLILNEHNQTHLSNTRTKTVVKEEMPLTLPLPVKSSQSNHTHANSEKTTPASKAKSHRCRQCSYVSSVKVKETTKLS